MKRIIRIGSFLVLFAASVAQAQVWNFHYADNYASGSPTYYHIVYNGQGAHSDPGNNMWNGFGPSYTANTGPNVTSSGAATGVTFSLGSGTGANGGIWLSGNGTSNPNQGTPSFLLGYNSLVNSGNPGQGSPASPLGTFTVGGLAAGTYRVYLYGSNYDADRGSVFSLSSGSAHLGINSTDNAGNSVFAEGVNYVYFDNVIPDGSGNIFGTFAPNTAVPEPGNPLTPNGEGILNGIQIVLIPEPSSLALLGLGMGGLLFFRRRK